MLLNRARAIKAMDNKDLDVLIASTPANIQYLTDMPSLRGYAILPRVKNLEPFLITRIYSSGRVADSGTWIKDIRYRGATYYFECDPNANLTDVEKKMKANVDSAIMDVLSASPNIITPATMRELLKGLQERGLDKSNLGIEEKGITITQFKKLEKLLPKANLVFADDAFAYARQVKTNDELKLFEESVPICDEGWRAVCEAARPGITEGELVKVYKKTVVSYGDSGAGIIYSKGPQIGRRTVMPPSCVGVDRSAKLERGDLISGSLHAEWKFHRTHHARTAVLGEPKNPKVNKYYQAILDAEDAGLEVLRPGVKCSEIYNIMIETARKTIPYFRRHHMGHAASGLGPGYDTPNFMANDHTPIEEGMVFNIEPSAFVEFGLGGLRLEDPLVITKNGYKLFTTTSRDLWRL